MIAIIAIAAFLSAFLGCVQAINVNRRRLGWAAVTSVGIALCQLSLYKFVPAVTQAGQAVVFVLAGVLGAQASMWVTCRAGHVKLPLDGRFVTMVLADGSEATGWYDRTCGWYRRTEGSTPFRVVGWRECAQDRSHYEPIWPR